jgi:hypothetical protein
MKENIGAAQPIMRLVPWKSGGSLVKRNACGISVHFFLLTPQKSL